jgi:branched-chain amino acid transport system substrate-binding protein
MKRALAGIVFLLALAFSVGAAAQITIGVNISATGPGASLGIPEKNVLAQYGAQEIAGRKVRWVIYDDASDPTTAVQNVKRLITEEKADLIVGPTLTTSALAVIDVAAEGKTPLLAFASATAVVAPMDAKRRWIFKVSANDHIYAESMVRHMVKKGVKTVSIIAFDDPYGESNTLEYKKFAEPKGIKTLTVEKFKRTDTSVTGQVLKAMQGNPDAIYIIGIGTPAALPHVALTERGYKGKIYQTGGVVGAEFLRVGSKGVEGGFAIQSPVVVAEQLPDGYPTKPEALKFIKAYEPKFGARSTFASQAWDAINIINLVAPKALKSAQPGTGEFREALRTAIEQTKYNGALAVYRFSPADHSGVDQLGIAILRIENGTWKLEDHAAFK